MKTLVILFSLLICFVANNVALIEAEADHRYLISQIQKTNKSIRNMRLEQSRLALEESVLTDETVIYQIAEKNLNMRLPLKQAVSFTN